MIELDSLAAANRLVEQYISLFNREQQEHNYYKAQLFDAWKSLQQQQKGMRRMARKIERQQFVITQQKIELASLRLELSRDTDSSKITAVNSTMVGASWAIE